MQLIWLLPSVIFGAYFGSTTGNWFMAAMSMASAMAWLLQARLRDIQNLDFNQPISIVGRDMWVGTKRLPKWRWLWRKEWNPHLVDYFQAQVKPESELSFQQLTGLASFRNPGRFKVWLGLTEQAEPILSHLIEDGAHLLIVGPTGAGKSKLLQLALCSLKSGQRSGFYDFGLIDFKGGSTFAGHWMGQVAFALDDLTPQQLPVAMHWLENEIARREELLAKHQCSDYLNLLAKKVRLPLFVVACDELPELLKQSRLALQTIESLAAKGRSLGMVLLATSQSLSGIPRSILVNLRQRVALTGTDSVDFVQLGFGNVRSKLALAPANHHVGYWLSAKRTEQVLRFPVDFNLEKSIL